MNTMTMMIPNKYFLILALDFDSSSSAIEFMGKVPKIKFVKIGMELFYSEGPLIIDKIKKIDPGIKIFLDLKINDIPKTIEKTVKKISTFQVDYLTLFTGKSGIEAALTGRGNNPLKILNVTVLTSEESSLETVLKRAQLSYEAQADGIICSGLETSHVRQIAGKKDFIIVNPGIRLKKDNDDQIRTVTPKEAFEYGATNIVVGRPITLSDNPSETVDSIFKSLE